MSLTNTQMTEIEEILKQSLRNKFTHYNPEPLPLCLFIPAC